MKNALSLLLIFIIQVGLAQNKLPIIDMHLHAYESIPPGVPASWAIEKEANILKSPINAEKHLQLVLAQMKKNNIVLALTSSRSIQVLKNWKQTAPGKFIGGIMVNNEGMPVVSADSLRKLNKEGVIDVFGELGFQYRGVSPDDPRIDPYYAIASENNIPVCLHTGLGPPGSAHSSTPKFRTTLGNPKLFEPVLVQYPKLKAFLAHAGWPYISETIALMYVYPELYVNLGILAWGIPQKAFYSYLKQLTDAGFGKRIMYGSDQMFWPEAIDISIKTINNITFLSEAEKRDILYNNAARFLELSKEVITKHHQIIKSGDKTK